MISIWKILPILIYFQVINGNLTVSNFITRVPHRNDIGLIIDLTVKNSITNNQPELLEFSVHAENGCNIYLSPDAIMENAGHLMGGYFGFLSAGASETVSLIWPTLSLFNRVGTCPIVIVSINPKKIQSQLKHEIHFDTTFMTLDPDGTGLRKDKNFRDCNNFDLDYLNDCQPVNCQERYFGRRNFFNRTAKRCAEVPRCTGHQIYDQFANECIDAHYTVTKEDIRKIRKGDFKEYDKWLKLQAEEESSESNSENLEKELKNIKRGTYGESDNEFEMTQENKFENNPAMDSEISYVLKGIINGMLLVFATIGIYILICFIIFLVVSFISKRQGNDSATVTSSITPSVSEKGIKCRSSTCSKLPKHPRK